MIPARLIAVTTAKFLTLSLGGLIAGTMLSPALTPPPGLSGSNAVKVEITIKVAPAQRNAGGFRIDRPGLEWQPPRQAVWEAR